MARITVATPQAVLFQTRIRVNIGDINYGNHLANDAVLRLCHEARLRWLAAHGFNEINIGGAGLIMADAAVQYKSEAFPGEIMVVQKAAADFGKYGCTLFWHMSERESGREVARGKTGIVFFDYAARKIVPVPQGFRDKLA